MKAVRARETMMMTKFTRLVSILLLTFSIGVYADGGYDQIQNLPEGIVELVQNEQYESAITALKKFIRKEKKSPDAWNLLGYSQRKTGLLDESLKSYKRALRLDAEHIGANEYIGELYLTLDQPKKARKHLKRLKRYCGECQEMQNLAKAIAEYEKGA